MGESLAPRPESMVALLRGLASGLVEVALACWTSSGSSPGEAWSVTSWWSRHTMTGTDLPMSVSATMRGRERISFTS